MFFNHMASLICRCKDYITHQLILVSEGKRSLTKTNNLH